MSTAYASSIDRLKRELEEKKAKLTALRETRERKLQSLNSISQSNAEEKDTNSSNFQLNNLLEEILHDFSNDDNNNARHETEPPKLERDFRHLVIDVPPDSSSSNGSVVDQKLSLTYEKSVQTEMDFESSVESLRSDLQDDLTVRHVRTLSSEPESSNNDNIDTEVMPDKQDKGVQTGSDVKERTELIKPNPLSQEEIEIICRSKEFKDFIDQASKVVTRIAEEPSEKLLVNYQVKLAELASGPLKASSSNDKYQSTDSITYKFDPLTTSRSVLSIDFSPHLEELFVVSYAANCGGSNAFSSTVPSKGLLLVWNQLMPSRPEITFHCDAVATVAKFNPFKPGLIVAGSSSGEIIIFSCITKSKLLKSSLASWNHPYAICSIEFLGNKHSHQLISMGIDGTVCIWSPEVLSECLSSFKVRDPDFPDLGLVAPAPIGFKRNETGIFHTSTELGTILAVNRQQRPGVEAGTDESVRYVGHTAPITSLAFHPVDTHLEFDDLLLSASLDWTVKLWNTTKAKSLGKRPQTQSQLKSSETFAYTSLSDIKSSESNLYMQVEPILTIEMDDMVLSAQWNPKRPLVFAAATNSGRVEVWDLTRSLEWPVQVPSDKMTVVKGDSEEIVPLVPITSLAWDQTTANLLAIGDLNGTITIFNTEEVILSSEGDKQHVRKLMTT